MRINNAKRISKLSIRLTIVLILLSACPFYLSAQYPNGSFADAQYITFLTNNLAAENALVIDTANPDLNVTLTIEPHIVSTITGELEIEVDYLENELKVVNSYFKRIGIQFVLAETDTVAPFPYGYISGWESTEEMENIYQSSHRINLFIVDSIVIDENHYMGYSYFPNDTLHNNIFIARTQVTGNAIAALLGNFFGLLRTGETAGGTEFESGLNCETLGDFLCDTYGDGGMFGMVDDECLYKGFLADPARRFYVPSVANVMSDSPSACRCMFTPGQYRRMKYYYLNYRSYLE